MAMTREPVRMGGRGMDLRRKGRARTELERFAAVHADALLRSAYLMGGVPLVT
jgi:hypothetical protein